MDIINNVYIVSRLVAHASTAKLHGISARLSATTYLSSMSEVDLISKIWNC